jgi:hypothetical protein
MANLKKRIAELLQRFKPQARIKIASWAYIPLPDSHSGPSYWLRERTGETDREIFGEIREFPGTAPEGIECEAPPAPMYRAEAVALLSMSSKPARKRMINGLIKTL